MKYFRTVQQYNTSNLYTCAGSTRLVLLSSVTTPEVKTSYLLILDGGNVSEFSDEERCWGDSPLESDGQQVWEFSWFRETGRILRRDSELIAPTGLKTAEGELWETGECGGRPHPVGRTGTSVLHQVSWKKRLWLVLMLKHVLLRIPI